MCTEHFVRMKITSFNGFALARYVCVLLLLPTTTYSSCSTSYLASQLRDLSIATYAMYVRPSSKSNFAAMFIAILLLLLML